ncbi:MAG: LLM class flavin-dependent oxidoreductase [Candidatus Rokubacteria bacterium]|nr:LLM class flavin-dependent oxidoreductase [Candidatus Rokubacteria bacterium]
MSTTAEFGIAIPQTFEGAPRPEAIAAFLARAEALGFGSAWVVEQVLGAFPCLAPLEILTWAAALTRRMRLGAAVLLTGLRSPVHTAKSLATLDHLSQGRLDVGVGLGGNPSIYPALAMTAARRAARFTEGLRLMRALWTEPRVTFAGDFFRLENAAMEPKPLQKPHPPLWFGAHHPNALRRTAELGDAFMGAGSLSTARFADEVKLLRGFLEAAGRDADAFPIGKRVYLAIDRDRARAARRLGEWCAAFYGRRELAEEISVWGSVEDVVDGLAQVRAAGARLIVLNPVFDERDHLEQLAADVVPRL